MNAFTEHPRSVGESYWEHMGVALSVAGAMAIGAMACLVHAFFPFLCKRTGGDVILALHARISNRR